MASPDRPRRTALTNVRVFDGTRLRSPGTVVLDGGWIGADASGAHVVDCAGSVLLPGLIDAHVHVVDVGELESLSDHGITTALDMAAWPPSRTAALRGLRGLTDLRSAGMPALPPGEHPLLAAFPPEATVTDPEAARRWVADRVAEGSDHIKLLVEPPTPGEPDRLAVLAALAAAARQLGRRTVAHAVTSGAVDLALRAGVDVITHVPLDVAVDGTTAARMAAEGRVAIPTLVMMSAVAERRGLSYDPARASVTALHRAGVPVLAGSDANTTPGAPAPIPHGGSIHRELELLVAAGLSTVDALRAATTLPAKHFGLDDRGVVEPGKRADLVLVAGDPIADITATRAVERVWCAGVERPVPRL
ncbi:amidohydrolase family protein [Saccharothrix coeruleofusca]|uniref:Amidohydrolase n=1 Tax=Saccharothrix coeruleofusca TaxID=33919 RepID=A0A918ASE8_9PSEU|nr:amidohydrolase family protein [Saccharothrix coeruleofusca]GGP77536.1 amidohydrolase [Saccharothrix coeruleofusca]